MENIIERIFRTGRITRHDQNWLCKRMLSDKPLNYEQNQRIRKLHDFVRMGFVQVID
ncbi:hypothetical protein [Rivularia sp. UHCC 0363]|uniref:hypothetical protein n=1 Tax=Rivularia sp. UHCC 0363 TaxID=3110244 RepID=UPI002B2037A8|nr:hypothetical protein [Rivularia sp. UHCC 0363]MEA5595195.1 hypothetical protein [Rivularia sp. UHCC 0363]